jgi:hypothetical protein
MHRNRPFIDGVGLGMTRAALVVLMLIVVSACGDAEPKGSEAPPQTVAEALAAHGLDQCEALDPIVAPAGWYRDDPVYVANEPPVPKVRAWASTRPGYQDIWLDRDRRGWITVAFSGDVDAREDELKARFPDVGAVAVRARSTTAERATTRSQVGAVLARFDVSGGSGDDVTKGVVGFGLGVLRDDVLQALERFDDAPVCFDGILPRDAVKDGPQPKTGDGWRLLADQRSIPYRTGVATTPEQYEKLWRTARLTGDRPAVDFDREIVVWLGEVFGSSCPIRLDDVIVDTATDRVYGNVVVPGTPDVCTKDANGRAFVLALERSRLPDGPFAVQLGSEDPPPGAPEERTLVHVDLRPPGSTASDAEIGPDPELIAASEEPQVVRSGVTIDEGSGWRYELAVTCGVRRLGEVNGLVWQTTTRDVPPEWASKVQGDHLVVDIELHVASKTITATAGGATLTYEPAPSGTPADPCAN